MTKRRELWMQPAKQRVKELTRLLNKVEKELSSLPEGRLHFSSVAGTPRYYLAHGRSGGNGELYLGKDRMDLVKKLARRRYLEEMKQSLEQEVEVLRRALERPLEPAPEDVYTGCHPALKELVDPMLLSDEEYTEWWLAEMRAGASGEELRSRIEKIIDQYYSLRDRPHVYEPSLYLEGYGPVRPDFAVLDLKTRRTFYHEHFGMMDNDDYRHKNMKKLAAYHANGFYEGINLIVTMEGEHTPIIPSELEEMLDAYFGEKPLL